MADATDVTSTTSTTDKEVSNGTALDIASKDVEKPNSKNELGKDIRRHPKYGLLYEVRRYNALYHLVVRLGAPEKKPPLLKRLKSSYRGLKRQLPLLIRFVMDILPRVGRRRVLICYLGDFLSKSVVPISRTAAQYDLSQVTIEAIATRRMNWRRAIRAISQDLVSYLLEQCLAEKLQENKAKLAYRYQSYIRETLMQARLELDSVTSANEKVIAHFKLAEKLLHTHWGGSFVLDQASTIINVCARITNYVFIMKRVAGQFNSPLATWSFLIKLFFNVTRYMKYLGYGSFPVTAITDENYRRSEIMAKASEDADAQDQVLGLRQYYFQQYKSAQEAVGDANPAEPDVYNQDVLHPWRSMAYKFIEKANSVSLYMLLALHTINQPPSSAMDALTVINELNAFANASNELSYETYRLFHCCLTFMNNITPIEKFYALSKIKPLLHKSLEPMSYGGNGSTAISTPSTEQLLDRVSPDDQKEILDKVDALTESAHQLSLSPVKEVKLAGMSIEFQSVSFTYPNKFKKALDNVSFKLEAGKLCSVVGFSGSGKSTLIALLVRLHDPDEGKILINGIDIKRYDPEDLYRHISYLFQATKRTQFTIREFIRLGRLDATDEEIEQAIKESGADQIIKKFPRGLDTELGQRHYSDTAVTVDMLVKRAQDWDESEMRWNNKLATGDEENDEETDPRTDSETLDKLLELSLPLSAPDDCGALDKWTRLAVREELPEPRVDEDIVLAPEYDAKKAEEEEKKNQVDSANFSGGEWAKVVLARSFLRQSADLVILDEFSAALDPLSEADIFEKFMKRRGQRTIIAVTHRFHLACRSDLILFLQDGQLKEKGAHHELMNLNGKYKEMYLKTTNTSGKEIACQTVPEGKEHEEVELNKTVEEKKDTKSTDENKEE